MSLQKLLSLFAPEKHPIILDALTVPRALARNEPLILKPRSDFLCNRVLAAVQQVGYAADRVQTFTAGNDLETEDLENRLPSLRHSPIVQLSGMPKRSWMTIEKAYEEAFPPVIDIVADYTLPEAIVDQIDNHIASAAEAMLIAIHQNELFRPIYGLLMCYADAPIIGIDHGVVLIVTAPNDV